jgi:UDP-N-acetylmuramate dehydrogenase
MKIEQNPSLGTLNSFGVEAGASALYIIETEEDVLKLPAMNPERDVLLGGGSNVLFVTDVPGCVYLNRIRGRAVLEDRSDKVLIEVGAGENWHDLVRWTLDNGLSGLENLSLIPGLAGASGSLPGTGAGPPGSVSTGKSACWATATVDSRPLTGTAT